MERRPRVSIALGVLAEEPKGRNTVRVRDKLFTVGTTADADRVSKTAFPQAQLRAEGCKLRDGSWPIA